MLQGIDYQSGCCWIFWLKQCVSSRCRSAPTLSVVCSFNFNVLGSRQFIFTRVNLELFQIHICECRTGKQDFTALKVQCWLSSVLRWLRRSNTKVFTYLSGCVCWCVCTLCIFVVWTGERKYITVSLFQMSSFTAQVTLLLTSSLTSYLRRQPAAS